MSSFSVLLEACVLYPAALRETLLRAAEVGLYRVHWSELILKETTRNLVTDARMTELDADDLVDAITDSFPEAMVRGFDDLIPVMRNDEKDRHALAAALACQAQVIVTSNLKDFPAAALERYAIEAQHPDAFLLHLLDLNPLQMTRLLKRQAKELENPPMTVQEVLDVLTVQAPKFAAAAHILLARRRRKQI